MASLISPAIICGAFLIVFASLKHGKAKSPMSGFGGISIRACTSSKVKPSTLLKISSAILFFIVVLRLLMLCDYSCTEKLNLTVVPDKISPVMLSVPPRR